jgi:ATP-binding cassette subfamily B protein
MSRDDTSEDGPLSLDVPLEDRRRKMRSYFLRYKWWFLLGAGFLVLTNLQKFTIPVYIGHAVELLERAATGEAALAQLKSNLVWAAIAIVLLAVGGAMARILSRITIFNPGRYIEFDIRNELYDTLAELTPAFYDPAPTGDLTSRVSNDVKSVRVFYALTYLHVINTAVAYAIGIWRMAQVDLELTLICLAPYPFLLGGILWLGQALFYQTKVVQSQLSDLSAKIQENLAGVSMVKAYDIQDREIDLFSDLNEEFFDEKMHYAVLQGGLQALVGIVAAVGTFILLVVGSSRVVAGDLSLGAFVEFNGYVVALAFPTISMGWIFSIWHRGRAAFDRIVEILAREPEIESPAPEDQLELPPLETSEARGRVEMRNVSFGYEDEQVLEEIDLEIPAGSTVAFVGKTGAGKSTLVELLTRLYDPDEGEVRIDGVPLDRVSLRQLRSELGFVPQEPLLFSMTVRENIRFGLDALEYDETIERPPPTTPLIEPEAGDSESLSQEERIEQAVDVAGLRPDIDAFNEGLETVVGERGVTLSGGQKQRVTLARALLVDPRILILDDALSSVDTQTEQVILDHLDYIMRDRTSIILTHRFNALDRVDRIYVLDEGRIVQSGTHAELMEEGGLYREMYRRQELEEDFET